MNQETETKDPLDDISEEELIELVKSIDSKDELNSGTIPSIKEKQDVMNFFNNVLNSSDTTKTGNLSTEELNSVRFMQRAGLYSLEVEYETVAKYIKKRAEIILATSLSGKEQGGFFLRLVNSSKKILETFAKKDVSPNLKKKGLFGGRK